MINNKIQFISKVEFDKLNFSEEIWVVKLNGADIQSERELFLALKDGFDLPDCHNWDAVLDWLTDLDWLNKESFVLIIKNYDTLFNYRLDLKEKFMTYLTEDVLQFWEKDVIKYVVDGYPKSFQVYCIVS